MNGLHGLPVAGLVAAALAGPLTLAPTAVAADFASDSYYQLDVSLETQQSEQLELSGLRGEPVVVAMFYSSCQHACPMIINTISAIEKKLLPAARERMNVLMISLDPERDTPAALEELAARHRVDTERWRFARTEPGEVRLLAAALDIKFRRQPDGVINHSSPILLLDPEGREIERSLKLGVPDPAFVQTVAAAFETE